MLVGFKIHFFNLFNISIKKKIKKDLKKKKKKNLKKKKEKKI